MSARPDLTITTRQGHPDFLDLPWHEPLTEWTAETAGIVRIPRGISRHIVRMVDYGGQVYAIKEISGALADGEYRMLRRLEDRHMPSVTPVGVVHGRSSPVGETLDSALITRYLEFSLPYEYLFRDTFTVEIRDRLLDAAVVLFARLHLEGFFWGDISLANVLFRRDAGALMAYLVDAETGEWKESLSDELRTYDLTLARENIAGGLFNSQAAGHLPAEFDPVEIVDELCDRYDRLWSELTREDEIDTSERWRIRQRIERLNDLGFDVEEMSVSRSADGGRLRFRPVVLEEGHAHLRLRRLTGIEAQENQARQLLNALDAHGLLLEREEGRALPEAVKAYRWLVDNYEPIIEAIPAEFQDRFDSSELIHEFIEHRFTRSVAEETQVDNEDAMKTFVALLAERPNERFVADN